MSSTRAASGRYRSAGCAVLGASCVLLFDPGQNGLGVGEDRPVGQLERRKLRVAGCLSQLLARALAQKRDRTAVSGNHLVVFDSLRAERLLHSATRWTRGPPSSPWQTNSVGRLSGIWSSSNRVQILGQHCATPTVP